MEHDYTLADNARGLSAKGVGRQDRQLNTYDYMADVPGNVALCDLVEVQFKNTRKDYFLNDNHLPLAKGDVVAVEASPGHDIGVVTLTGSLVEKQVAKAHIRPNTEWRRIYRKARPIDIDKYRESKALEHDTMIRSRQIAKDLGLEMKIGDVEYQGDGNKAIFYYIADGRVDFRQLIRVLADEFRVRIEMKQIGARQEAGRIGGFGPCGRELCCATWMKNFSSVSTAAVRFQDIAPNPQKLAGQCSKLKCCMNYEVDTYMEAAQRLPDRNVRLETQEGTYYYFKADTLQGTITYSSDRRMAANLVTLTADEANAIIEQNKRGEKPERLTEPQEPHRQIHDVLAGESLTRFDKKKGERRQASAGKSRKNRNRGRGQRPQKQA